MKHPTWLIPSPNIPSLSDWLEDARRQLGSGRGILSLELPESTTRLSLLGALSRDHPGDVLAVRLTGCRDAADVVRSIGFALNLPLPGEATRVGEALATRGNTLMVLEGGEAPGTLEVIENLRGLAPHVRILLGTNQSLPDLPRLDTTSVLPYLPTVQMPTDLPHPTASQSALAHIPAGIDSQAISLPDWAILPIDEHTHTLLPEHRNRILELDSSDPRTAARVLLPLVSTHMELATSRALKQVPKSHEVLLARFLADHLSWPSDACAAAAMAARLVAITGQLQTALSIVQDSASRHENASEADLALLSWAEGDVFLRCGLVEESHRAHEQARTGLADEPELRLTLLRRCGDGLANHALFDAANIRYQQARHLARELGDPLVHAATLRGSADLAVFSGENRTADALYDQAQHLLNEHPRSAIEQANLDVGRATLHLSRGEFQRCATLLTRAAHNADTCPELQASIAQRGAELLLRQGRIERAEAMIRTAIRTFQQTGQHAASARGLRTQGDIYAVSGRYLEAVDSYEHSIAQCARSGEFPGALKALAHQLALERTGTDTEHIERLEMLHEELDQLAGPHLDDTTGR